MEKINKNCYNQDTTKIGIQLEEFKFFSLLPNEKCEKNIVINWKSLQNWV